MHSTGGSLSVIDVTCFINEQLNQPQSIIQSQHHENKLFLLLLASLINTSLINTCIWGG